MVHILKRLVFILVLGLASAAAPAARSSPGAPGLGDRLFPAARQRRLRRPALRRRVRYAASAPAQPVDGDRDDRGARDPVAVELRPGLGGDSYGAVAVNGRPAAVAATARSS